MAGARATEMAAAKQYGTVYVPGQAAGTAARQAAGYGSFMNTLGYQGAQGPNSLVQGAPLVDSFNRTSSHITNNTDTPAAGDATSQPPSVVGAAYSLESDPVYQAAMASGQSQFNAARAAAMANKNTQEMQLGNQRRNLDVNATESRRRTAGNFAARGMAGGATGALTLAEMQANAQQITAQTDIKDQIASLNSSFLENYGNSAQPGYDWTGTLIGQNYKTAAAQAALNAQLARMGAA
jgi:hypothetical protein